MAEADRQTMLAQFKRLAASRRLYGDWDEADVDELGRSIKAAFESGDRDRIQGAADYLASQCVLLDSMDRAARDAFNRIKGRCTVRANGEAHA